MPFKSQKQRAWMYANEPEMAKEWEAHTPKSKKLPKKVAVKKNTAKKTKLTAKNAKKTFLGNKRPNKKR
jgi:hypothetical protein